MKTKWMTLPALGLLVTLVTLPAIAVAHTSSGDQQQSRLTTVAAPQPRSPASATTLPSIGPVTVAWDLPLGATQVHLQVRPSKNDGPGVNLILNSTDQFTVPGPVLGGGPYVLLPDMTYTWQVRATDRTLEMTESDTGWGEWSPAWTFRTPVTRASNITALAPSDGESLLGTPNLALQWSDPNEAHFYYEIQVSRDRSFGSDGPVAAVYEDLWHGGESTPLNTWRFPDNAPLVCDQMEVPWFWRVRPRVQGDGTAMAWSKTFSFTPRRGGTQSDAYCGPGRIQNPSEPPAAPQDVMGSALTDGRIRLVWTDRSLYEERFEVAWAAPGSDIERLKVRKNEGDPTVKYTIDPEQYPAARLPGRHSFRVFACNAAGCSPGSEQYTVEVQGSPPPVTPTPNPIVTIAAVSAGDAHTCAAITSSKVKCWGDNSHGQLGDGTTIQRTTPVEVIGLSGGVVSMSAGHLHTCALTSAGGLECWGRNYSGELGDGTADAQRATPVKVVGLSSGVVSVSAGMYYTCAVTSAKSVKCWGDNSYGQLGDGTSTRRTTPVDVVGLSGVISVTAGSTHTCAVIAGDGVKCWGSNDHGQLGDGTTIGRPTPAGIVAGSSGGNATSSGYWYSCAVTKRNMKCWGDNGNGQLGDGTTVQRTTPVDVIDLGPDVLSISTGYHHTCAVTAARGVKCWGNNDHGKLGDGTTKSRTVPVETGGLSSVAGVSGRGNHACASMTGGGVKCWGENRYGQLGDGTTSDRSTAVEVTF